MPFSSLKKKLQSKLNPTNTSSTPEITTSSASPVSGTSNPADTTQNPQISDAVSKTILTNELTDKEMKLETAMGVSDKEKKAAAEERRKYVKEYLRRNQQSHAYMMGGINSYTRI
ncbi:hypothetical protein K469DRAFT_710859 [Zopfia rhizophila CBS 207.26]|uniref:Uncharacterized protein n=1 Tax=Zopfia rhizophila CBS 207.26 TaxID=1314779 RepID=A0A6A6DZH2_9PEZI|nr:hypothetical protein K469DRAFT_710859 [Zopfia rhizophila CBS 207.26]